MLTHRHRHAAPLLICLAILPVLHAASAVVSGAEAPLWNVAWITDTQTTSCERITSLIRRVQADQPELVIHTGDTRFEWANQCAWQDVITLVRSRTPPLELHLAPGNHDLEHGVLHAHLRRAASRGIYRVDTGQLAEGRGYYRNRVTADARGPEWPTWNPEVVTHPAWQPSANRRPKDFRRPEPPYRYVFKRGRVRFIVCDCYYSEDQRDWVRDLIVQPDDSSVSIVLQHVHEVDPLAEYVKGLKGQHNVKLVLTGHHHQYCYEERHGVTFITAAGMARGKDGDCDAMTLWVYPDRLRLDRYVLPAGAEAGAIEEPVTIWECPGHFSPYERPTYPPAPATVGDDDNTGTLTSGGPETTTRGPDLLYNGGFDNGVWYERFRGWSPAGWYQWFTCGDDAPEHAVGKDVRHSGKEYVRIHMWAHAWRGGILQNVRDVEPCHWYRLRAYGWFARTAEDPESRARIGIDPCGALREQFAVDVTRHPAPAYNECVGDDPKTPEVDWPDLPDTTVWTGFHNYYNTWGRFEISAEARSDVITAILYCDPEQRSEKEPIYEMNWDTVSLYEVPWPTPRLADEQATLDVDDRFDAMVVTVQPELRTAQVTWRTPFATGAAQVLYRFLDSDAVNRQPTNPPGRVPLADFPHHTPVAYERSARWHRVAIEPLSLPESAEQLQVVVLSRAVINGECRTLCSPVQVVSVR